MIIRAQRAIPVVAALIIAVCIAGCASNKKTPLEKMAIAFADVRAEVQAVVTDPDRASQANDLVEQLEQTFRSSRYQIDARKAKLEALNEDYDASRADMEEQLDLILSDVAANQKEALVLRGELSKLLTAAEWDAIDKARSKALDSAIKALGVS
jgi:hypothetical protein